MPKAFTESERQLISERLLEAGEKQFAAHGLKKTTIDELAEAAGISKGAFYLFHESKEALFMDVVELAETRYRETVLAVIDQPGESPHARLTAVFRHAFRLWKQIPILQVFNKEDLSLMMHKVPVDKLQAHLASDRLFVQTLVERCDQAGIPIHAPVQQLDGLLHALFFTSLHEDEFAGEYPGTMDLLIELLVAYALGEVTPQDKLES